MMIGLILFVTLISSVQSAALNVTGKSLFIEYFVFLFDSYVCNIQIYNNAVDHVFYLVVQLVNVVRNMDSENRLHTFLFI